MKLQDNVLHKTALEVSHHVPVSKLIEDMFYFMYQHKGIGLAAPQIGLQERIFVMHANGFKQAFINPIITKVSGGKVTSKEGCLSFPNKQVTVVRDRQITIEGLDQNWKPIKRKLKGLAAICAQHEVDHLNGITLLSRLKS